MKIEIKNLGAINKASFDLSKKLTVFCGPNNSGKTYVAFMIYALTKSGNKFFRNEDGTKILGELLNKGNIEINIDLDKIWQYREKEIKNIKHSLDSIYGISEDITNHLFGDFDISIIETKEEFIKKFKIMSFSNEVDLRNTCVLISKHKEKSTIQLELKSNMTSESEIEVLSLFLLSKIYSLIAFFPFTSSHILPVERNSIYTFSKELSIQKQEFLEQAQELGSKKSKDPFHWYFRRSTRYPMPIRDGLEIAEDLSNLSKTKSESFELAEEIETELLYGKVVVSKEGDVQFSSNKAKSKKIPIHLSASIVKTLSSLVFYLKFIATKDELIIIDEPELNLHPNNQVILTRIFAKLVNRGFRMLISTHSDYVIRELNNLIMSSSPRDGISELSTKLGYTHDLKLSPDIVKAYLFNYKNSSSRNVTVSDIEVDEFGFDVRTIDETVETLNQVSEEFFYTIKYGKSEDESN
ncbi:MAG: AAA family ATPase [Bacteroidales bacterium]|nr:AAA family ATPase [Bacteroidales bacterium]